MNEESQLEDMRAALRGDRERAEARRSTENVRALVEPAAPAPTVEPQVAEPPRRRGLIDRLLGR